MDNNQYGNPGGAAPTDPNQGQPEPVTPPAQPADQGPMQPDQGMPEGTPTADQGMPEPSAPAEQPENGGEQGGSAPVV